mmetsp:Transcript_21138/g.54122  ORF Transcript_21138/g.54122 Transcript_21138/m.54122 type:complete len:1186 (+) Transcript_21138:63-3620(+)|eukprot:CAMPEP_0115847992 /NCGR_PEP_ID=MMETSP0287-20121206/10681_1 /TAXON_ID=412157 /ORGANISM="Chrysochromulina rotalis, Strain UIO044" /LENGTH=1185 /DNA_ID=CAMNT_0003301869 /DNA_START=40 /DNA_END=3597 /DNA_ORIENTATION=-
MASEAELERDMKFMDRNSRMIGAFGLDVIAKMVGMKVLLVGCKGVGIEVAKNAVLAGLHTLTIFDPTPTAVRDLGGNFFLTEADIGKPRAVACAPRVAELNSNVLVQAAPGDELTEELVSQHTIVVFTRGSHAELTRWNGFCRTQSPAISFFSHYGGGAWGGVFVDHGDAFTIRDANGRAPLIKLLKAIEVKDDHILVRYDTPDGQPPEALPDGGLVEFDEVEGLVSAASWPESLKEGGSLNDAGPVRTSHDDKDPVKTFRVAMPPDLSGPPTTYLGGGVITEKKEPKTVAFRSFAECATSPGGVVMAGDGAQGFLMTDMTFSMVELQLHVAQQGVYAFEEAHGRLPQVNDAADAAEVVTLARAFEAAHGVLGGMGLEVDAVVAARVAAHAQVELQPMCAFWGGVIAQELVKISGKYTPIQQFLHLQAFAALPETPLAAADTAPLGCRYDDMIAIYGRAFQERLGDLRIFMVGCGALGCEYVKNFALLGVCCGPSGSLVVTDNDRIEVSNLNRQFLFREDNVGKPKSEAAAARALTMNPALKIEAKQDLVASTTEHIFDTEFWNGLDLVCNALDNMTARLYVDGQCVFYEKPLLESGTMGTGANVDIVVPHMTRSYADGGAADEGGGVPMCTLRNFPHLIDHCIEWARAKFEDLFADPAQKAAKVLDDVDTFLKKTRAETLHAADGRSSKIVKEIPKLQTLIATLEIGAKGPTMEDAVRLAWRAFHELFRDMILDLTDKFPEDATTTKGDPFWSGHKRFPKAQTYDPSDTAHVEFMIAASNLFAAMLGIPGPKPPSELNDARHRWQAQFREREWLSSMIAAVGGPPERKRGSVDLEGDDSAKQAEPDMASEEATLEGLLAKIESMKGSVAGRFDPADFEKDDDDNFHIDFVTACSNLRAANYHIPSASRHKCKMIAGRIIPAIATTTASVTGLVMLEMFKVLQGKSVEQLRNGNYDLGSNQYMMFEAEPPAALKTHVEITMPDPKEHPDAYDAKGNLVDMYRDPDMCLGFAENVICYPDPHSKYDKFWVGPVLPTATVGELRDAIDAHFKEAGLHVAMIAGPTQRIECEKDEHNPSGLKAGSRALWNPLLSSTKANLDKPWAALLKQQTTRDEMAWQTIDDPVDVSGKRLCTELVLQMQNDDGDDVTTPAIIVKLSPFEFVSFKERKQRGVAPWLAEHAKKQRSA